jgi:hypothetical protein
LNKRKKNKVTVQQFTEEKLRLTEKLKGTQKSKNVTKEGN